MSFPLPDPAAVPADPPFRAFTPRILGMRSDVGPVPLPTPAPRFQGDWDISIEAAQQIADAMRAPEPESVTVYLAGLVFMPQGMTEPAITCGATASMPGDRMVWVCNRAQGHSGRDARVRWDEDGMVRAVWGEDEYQHLREEAAQKKAEATRNTLLWASPHTPTPHEFGNWLSANNHSPEGARGIWGLDR